MTEKDMKPLALLLDSLFPSAPAALRISANEHTALAYRYALSPYTYEQVREGVLAAARSCRMYPSVAEIIQGIPAPPPLSPAPQAASWMLPYIQNRDTKHTGSISRYARERGLTWPQAKEVLT